MLLVHHRPQVPHRVYVNDPSPSDLTTYTSCYILLRVIGKYAIVRSRSSSYLYAFIRLVYGSTTVVQALRWHKQTTTQTLALSFLSITTSSIRKGNDTERWQNRNDMPLQKWMRLSIPPSIEHKQRLRIMSRQNSSLRSLRM